MFREVICKFCDQSLGHSVVGETGSGLEAIRMVRILTPALVILDLVLPDIDGFTVAERLLAELPGLRILMISGFCNAYSFYRVECSGVCGFIDKNINSLAALDAALQAVASGRGYFSSSYEVAREARRSNPHSFDKILSFREIIVLGLIGKGLDDEEIGRRLNISERTASTHRGNILKKLGIKGTPKLIAYAREQGFV